MGRGWIVDGKELRRALEWAIKPIRKDQDGKVDCVIEDGQMRLSSNSSNAYACSHIRVGGDMSWSVTMEAPLLTRILPILSHGETRISRGRGDSSLHMVTERRESFRVPTVASRIRQPPQLMSYGQVRERAYFAMLSKIAPLCEHALKGVPMLKTVAIDPTCRDGELMFTATDRFVLGHGSIDFRNENGMGKIHLPYDMAGIVPPGDDDDAMVTLIGEKGSERFGYQFPDGRYVLFPQNGVPLPNVAPILDAAHKVVNHCSCTVSAKALRTALKNVNIISQGVHSFIDVGHDSVTVADETRENSIVLSDVDTHGVDDNVYTLSLTREPWDKALSAFGSDEIVVSWKNGELQVVMGPVGDDTMMVIAALNKADTDMS